MLPLLCFSHFPPLPTFPLDYTFSLYLPFSHLSLALSPYVFRLAVAWLSQLQDLTLPPSPPFLYPLPSSPPLSLFTPPFPPGTPRFPVLSVLSFSLDSRWGLHADRLALGRGQTYARSVPGLSLLQAADRTLTSCHLTSDLLVADLAVNQGRHYWACSVEPGSYLVKVRGDAYWSAGLTLQCTVHIESALPYVLTQNGCDESFQSLWLSLLQVGVGQEAKLQEWFHLPQDMASPR